MAPGRKPSGKSGGNSSNKSKKGRNTASNSTPQVVLPGKPVMFVGFAGARFTCPTCGSQRRKGIVYRHTDNIEYCTRGCLPL